MLNFEMLESAIPIESQFTVRLAGAAKVVAAREKQRREAKANMIHPVGNAESTEMHWLVVLSLYRHQAHGA
jgi:hypothetical protein